MEENIKEQENKVVETPVPEKKEYNVLGVMFEITKKRYYFEVIDNTEYKKGDKVIVDTVRGKEVGVVYGEPRMLPEKELVLPLKPVIKKADEDEIKRYNELKEESAKANKLCKERIIHHKLPMKLVGTEYTFDRSKLIFYFTAEGRIDFRDLVKDLANIFKLRIELRQIGVRDEARILGTIGICGKELCCRTFINKFDSVSIKMARDQGLVINPAKISGVCGRLLCCINYEYAQYEEVLRHYPAVNQLVKTPKGEGKVISISPLNGYLFVDVATIGMMRFEIEEIKFNKKEANKLKNEKTQEELEHKELEKE
ncbi:stage 0 sporulation family protein [Fusobacterium sp.]|jgi:cell fate regulator YaaT (PSP1 superfamily)|uniref:PSP1 domain-containing protein n=1 Tax=Fusobacterium sp. TaxID=68766 RepID=UPI001D3502A5|nr:stage 0 sporulation family protein [Fusobacterium sp.]MBS5789219.1 stage 0 sporulation family protein [Fusobacterium sp.]